MLSDVSQSAGNANHLKLRLLSTANELFPEHHPAAVRLLGAGGEL
jgi:hypothetical protein